MPTDVLQFPPLDSDLTHVLAAYGAAQPVVTSDVATDEAVGWIPRLPMVAQVSPERLPPIHGRLIALGLLRFQFLNRSGGMVYRLSPEGRSALAAALGQNLPSSDESEEGTDDCSALEESSRESALETVDSAE